MINLFLLIVSMPLLAFSNEIWGYLMQGEEKNFPIQSGITDIAHFSSSVQADGTLSDNLDLPPEVINASPDVRRHIVITAPWNSDLYHHYLNPDLPFRETIIQEIKALSKPYDGVQIDFEGISSRDGTAFLNFLIQLKKSLPKDKILSVAVMARWEDHKKKYPRDAYDYPLISRIVDRVIIMAYDEHYRTGPPGPIASINWCIPIFNYALKTIPKNKLIMGIPLYGRAWQTKTLSKAYKHHELVEELKKRSTQSDINSKTGGHFSFNEKVKVEVYHETIESINAKKNLYLSGKIKGLAYWRISQEPEQFKFTK